MNFSTVFFCLFSITSLIYIIHLGFYLISASLYDVWQHRRLDRMEKNHTKRMYQPRVTVLVPAHNEEKVIVRCLNSIFNSTYKHFEVIVINDFSTDGTKRILNLYATIHPEYRLRIVHKRINVGKGSALNYALRRYVDSELVMMLDADSVLTPLAIECAVTYFSDSTIAGVAANVQIINEHTALSILQKFEHMIGYRAKKAYSMTNSEFVIGGVASTYRMGVIRSVGFYDTDTTTEDISLSIKIVAKGNKAHRLVYAADVMAMTEPVESLSALFRQRYRWKYGSLQNLFKHKDLIGKNDEGFTSMLTIYRMPMAVLTEALLFLLPFTWIYAVYLTMAEKSLSLLFGAYITVTVYMFMTLWFDEHLPYLERLYLTMYVPVAYFIFFVMDFIQIIAVSMCLLKFRQLTHKETTASVWKSPERIGRQVAVLAMSDSANASEEAHE